MASPTQWTWAWVNSGSWWWTGRPGVLQSMGSQSRTRLKDWTELNRGKDSLSSVVGQSCLTFCNSVDYSLPGSSVHVILLARILEWVAIPFSSGSSWPRDWIQFFCIAGRFFTIWAREALLYTVPKALRNKSLCWAERDRLGVWDWHYTQCYTVLCLVMSDSLWPHGLLSARLPCLWGFSRQEYWSGLPCSPPGALPNPGIEPRSPALQVESLPSEPPGKPTHCYI